MRIDLRHYLTAAGRERLPAQILLRIALILEQRQHGQHYGVTEQASDLGVSQALLSCWRMGTKLPGPERRKQLAEAYPGLPLKASGWALDKLHGR